MLMVDKWRNQRLDDYAKQRGYALAYEPPDACGLEAVVCPGEGQTISNIIMAIAQLETQRGKTAVGNNLTGIKGSNGQYLIFDSFQASLDYSEQIWTNYYGSYPLDQALARWKTGDPNNTDPATIRYISNAHYLLGM